MLAPSLKPKTCTHCKREFMPARLMQNVCGPVCAGRKVKAAKKAETATTRARKETAKTIPKLLKEAQHEFNAWVRERDKHQPCICCGRPLQTGGVSGSTGGDFDCGHYRSVGSASHLRFDPRNANGQRKQCNRYGAGRAVDYRIGLIKRIGLREVEALEASNEVHKWTKDELRAIRDKYRALTKELKKGQE
jgi:hypothetical protein